MLADEGIVHSILPAEADELALVSAAAANADCTVLDGYHFDAGYVASVDARRLLVIDDCAALASYDCDLIVNPSPSAESLAYPETRARLLLGSRYAMLRHEFRSPPPKQIAERASRILVTLGGSDPANLTAGIARALPADVEAKIVVGPENTRWHELPSLPSRIEIVHSPPRMSELMAWADIAVAASGMVSLELACLGVPMILVATADNQEPLARWFGACGAAVDLGHAVEGIRAALAELAPDRDRRMEMSRAGRAAIDGEGAGRVVEELLAQS